MKRFVFDFLVCFEFDIQYKTVALWFLNNTDGCVLACMYNGLKCYLKEHSVFMHLYFHKIFL